VPARRVTVMVTRHHLEVFDSFWHYLSRGMITANGRSAQRHFTGYFPWVTTRVITLHGQGESRLCRRSSAVVCVQSLQISASTAMSVFRRESQSRFCPCHLRNGFGMQKGAHDVCTISWMVTERFTFGARTLCPFFRATNCVSRP
jgi:hypothetical protein